MPSPASPNPNAQSVTPPPAPPAPGRPVLRILLRVLAALVLLALLACGYAGYDAWRFLHTPPASPGADVYVDVEPGATFDRVTKQLVDKGAVTSDWRFKLLAHYHGWEGSLKAGRFLVHSNWAPFRVLDQLVNGQPVLSRITLREGLTWWETARLLEAEGFVTVEDFRAVITDPAFLRHWGIPFDTAEGFLFPDTYLIKKPTTPDRESARAVAGRMVDTFWRRAAQVWPDGRPARDELRRLVTLASIVEKETGQPSERGRVAGVYANRLRTGMLLQADPTTIYGLGDTFDGNLRRSHLQDAANPYNTYRRPGLPPGPICSPGLESLRAATTPEKHGYFYFVSRNDGTHQFSATLDEHNRAVNRFQRGGRAKGTDQAVAQDSQGTPAIPAPATESPDGANGANGPNRPNPTDTAPPAPQNAEPGTPAPASPATQAKTPEGKGTDTVPATGGKAAAFNATTSGNATQGADAAKPATPPAEQPADPRPSGAPVTPATPVTPGTPGTDAPAVSQAGQTGRSGQASPMPPMPENAKASAGAKQAPAPLPRTAPSAGNGTAKATGTNAATPTNASVRAPTAPREGTQAAPSGQSGPSAQSGQPAHTEPGTTGSTGAETSGAATATPHAPASADGALSPTARPSAAPPPAGAETPSASTPAVP